MTATSGDDTYDGEILRRSLVAIATASYDDPNYKDLPVEAELRQLRDWLCDERLGPRAFGVPPSLASLAHDPGASEIHDAMADWSESSTVHDAAVIFVTGHGQVANGQHWTVLKKSSSRALSRASLRTADLINWLADSEIEHLLLIIDTCFAGHIAEDAVKRDRRLPDTWLILPSAMKDEEAEFMALTRAIEQAVEKLKGDLGEKYGSQKPYFKLGEFIAEVREALGPAGQTFRPIHPAAGFDNVRHVCLPNPHFAMSPMVPTQDSRRELALPKDDLKTHWAPRSRGVESSDIPGWLFTGRAALMRELIGITREGGGTTLVTGVAGCGKSAVLARLVTLSDPDFLSAYRHELADVPEDLMPDLGAVDVAIWASRKHPYEILGQLCAALRVPGTQNTSQSESAIWLDDAVRAWTDWTSGLREPVTIVVDALDEAYDPRQVAALLVRLTAGPGADNIRLIVGVRSPGRADGPASPSDAGEERPLADDVESKLGAHRLRADEDPWWDQDDVRAYAASILLNTEGSPYAAAEHHEVAGQIARIIGQRSGSSFLIARITATSLAGRAHVIAPDDETWQAAISDGVVGVFREDLWQSFPADRARRESTVALLRALAYAYGRGLPWAGVWPSVADAITDRPGKYGDSDIVRLLKSRMSAYIVTDNEDDTTVYRLFHEVLRTTLRDDWQRLLADPRTLAAPGT